MNFFIAEIINAIKLGSIYALIAIGYSIVSREWPTDLF